LNERHNLFLIRIIHKELGKALHFAIGGKGHRLDAGDVLVVMGPAREIQLLKKKLNHAQIYKI
jgi:voltage-gated potassium channel